MGCNGVMLTNKYDAFIFDFYGTLAEIKTNENKPYLWKKCAQILTEMGYPYDAKTLRREYISFVLEEKEKLAPYYECPEIELRHVFRKLMSPWATDEEIAQFAITFRVLSREYIFLYEEIHAIFDYLHSLDKKVYLLSNAQSCFTVPEMKALGIYESFDDIFISSDYECAKPDPKFMNMLIKKHKLDVSRSLMIGNEVTSDIAIANAVGMDSFYIRTLTSSDAVPAVLTASMVPSSTGLNASVSTAPADMKSGAGYAAMKSGVDYAATYADMESGELRLRHFNTDFSEHFH